MKSPQASGKKQREFVQEAAGCGHGRDDLEAHGDLDVEGLIVGGVHDGFGSENEETDGGKTRAAAGYGCFEGQVTLKVMFR